MSFRLMSISSDTLVGDDLKARLVAVAHIDLHHALIQLALAELLPQLLPRPLIARLARLVLGSRRS